VPPQGFPPAGMPGVPPQKSRKGLWITLGIIGAVLLLCCGGVAVFGGVFANEVDKAIKEAEASQGTVSASASPSDGSSAAPADVAKIGTESFTYDDGLTVAVISATRFAKSDTAAGGQPGEVGVTLTVKVTNNSKKVVDLDSLTVGLKAGADGLEADSVFDSARGIGGGLAGSVAPGRSASGVYGFSVLPANLNTITVEVTPSFDHEPSLFEGSVK
jgi:hypothetical protein